MKKIPFVTTLIMAMLLSISSVMAEAVLLNKDVPEKYVVKRGDTLWDISGVFLQDPWMWPEIWHANQQIENPHLIYPGDTITLVYIDGVPQLVVNRSRDLKLSPEIRAMDHAEAISALPLEVIDNFLSKTRVTDDVTLRSAPYVLGGTERRISGGHEGRLLCPR